MSAVACQRWNRGRSRWAPTREVIEPARFGVEQITERQAKAFICAHHYSGSVPPIRRAYGLMRIERGGIRLVGACAFTVPMQPAAVSRWCRVSAPEGIELGRLVLLDDVAFNGESFFVARALRQLHEALPDLRAVLSYSDPVPRHRLDGTTVLRGHVGTVYQSLGMSHLGRSAKRTLYLAPDASVVSERSLSKIRNGERGAEGAYRNLVALGAPPIRPGESGAGYLRRALDDGPFRRLRHPGNLVYVTALGGRKEKKAHLQRLPQALPYPKQRSAA